MTHQYLATWASVTTFSRYADITWCILLLLNLGIQVLVASEVTGLATLGIMARQSIAVSQRLKV